MFFSRVNFYTYFRGKTTKEMIKKKTVNEKDGGFNWIKADPPLINLR